MNIIDVIILLIIIIFALIGFKRGFLHSTVVFVGTILVVVLSFIFKNYISIILYENLPFFRLWGLFKNISVINILLYEVLAFIIVAIVLTILLKIIIVISKIIEKILKFTIILGIPSKIAGAVVGAIEGYVIAFAFIYILTLPIFNVKELEDSKYSNKMLTETPVLSNLIDDTIIMLDDFEVLKDEYSSNNNANEFNLKALDLFLKYDIISIESVDKLIEKDKLKIDNIENVLDNYREVQNENND